MMSMAPRVDVKVVVDVKKINVWVSKLKFDKILVALTANPALLLDTKLNHPIVAAFRQHNPIVCEKLLKCYEQLNQGRTLALNQLRVYCSLGVDPRDDARTIAFIESPTIARELTSMIDFRLRLTRNVEPDSDAPSAYRKAFEEEKLRLAPEVEEHRKKQEAVRKKQEDEARERARIARETAEKMMAERKEKLRIENEAREKEEAEAKEKARVEKEAREKAAAEAKEKARLEREEREKAAAEQREKERRERMAKEKAEAEAKAAAEKAAFDAEVMRSLEEDSEASASELARIETALSNLPNLEAEITKIERKHSADVTRLMMAELLPFSIQIDAEVSKLRARYWIYEATRKAKIDALNLIKHYLSAPSATLEFENFIKAMKDRVPTYQNYQPELAMSSKVYSESGTAKLVDEIAKKIAVYKSKLSDIDLVKTTQIQRRRAAVTSERQQLQTREAQLRLALSKPLDQRRAEMETKLRKEMKEKEAAELQRLAKKQEEERRKEAEHQEKARIEREAEEKRQAALARRRELEAPRPSASPSHLLFSGDAPFATSLVSSLGVDLVMDPYASSSTSAFRTGVIRNIESARRSFAADPFFAEAERRMATDPFFTTPLSFGKK
jgi:hypothetical protein